MSKRRKVVLIASWYPYPGNPVLGVFVHDQVHALESVYDVAVIVPQPTMLGDVLHGKWPRKPRLDHEGNVPVYRRSYGPLPPRCPMSWWQRWADRAVAQGFAELLANWGRPDLIHAHVVLPGGHAAMVLGRQYGIPVVLTEHTSYFAEAYLGTRSGRRLCRETFEGCQRVIGDSPEMCRAIHELVPAQPAAVVGCVVKTRFFLPDPDFRRRPGDPTVFLLQAVLVERKGGRHLIEAARLLRQRGRRDFRIRIGGDGESRGDWERLVDQSGLGDCFQFLGRLSFEEVRREMQQCDVFVLPSLHENFGIVSGEAMACGKPVLSTYCGGSEFVVTPETGVLVPPADPVALADAMQGFLDGRYPFDSARIRESVVERFGEEAFLAAIQRVYEEVLCGCGKLARPKE